MIERYFKYLFCIVVVISTCCSCSNTREKLLVSGCGWKQVAILDKKTGEIESYIVRNYIGLAALLIWIAAS